MPKIQLPESQNYKTQKSENFIKPPKIIKIIQAYPVKNDLFREPWCLQLTQFLFPEVEHLIDNGTYESRNQGDTLSIKWKLQSPPPIAEELYAVGSNDE